MPASPRSAITWFLTSALGCALAGMARADDLPRRDHFLNNVRPLLKERCQSCHGAQQQEGGLRLDRKSAALEGGSRGTAIIPGNGTESRLVRLLTGENDEHLRMPPEGPPLSEDQIAAIRRWIDDGGFWPDDESAPTDEAARHWAFQPLGKTIAPDLQDPWIRNPIDAFVLVRAAQAGLPPAPQADRLTLLRRLSFDLRGLPPTPEEARDFLDDLHPDAYERLVDRLLASPQYGERWGRHWLDAAHYADSGGFESDTPRTIWRYRDWVIAAINADLPFDQFTMEQLAGDLLPGATPQQRVATGFLLNSPQDGGSEPSRIDALVDRLNTVGTVFLGMTLACAQCHNHKFDPITQRDYYRMFAFLNDADEMVLELGPPDEVARRDALQAQLAVLHQERDKYREGLAARLPEWEGQLTAEERGGLTEDVRSILGVVLEQRTPNQQKRLLAALAAVRDPGYRQREATIQELEAQLPQLPTTPALQATAAPRETRILIRGELANPGVTVEPGVTAVLPELESHPAQRATRLDLARWLVSPAQPLTARVTVNRIWQQLFGLGLVETENDFGTQGSRPTHPELLDWLAARFVADGWSVKRLQRLILTSATYRQSSSRSVEQDRVDPRNLLLARQNRLRLEAESIRDAALAASGLLDPRIGGAGVFPPQPSGILVNRATPAEWRESTGGDRYRRGMYTYFFRLTPHPFLPLFDAPDSLAACTRRRPTNTPLQALTLMNDPWFTECAAALAKRALRESASDDDATLRQAFQLCLARPPRDEELAVLRDLLDETRREATAPPANAAGSSASGGPEEQLRQALWSEVCRALLNLDEFITRE
ncbi:MAG: PSD1 and planctomycete cytochrome C domain-containing protein [Planctomycetales bacterium]